MSLLTKLMPSWTTIAVALFVAGLVWLGYTHYTSLIDDIKKLEASNARLSTQVAVQHEAIKEQEKAVNEWQQAEKKLTEQMQKLQDLSTNASKELERLNEVLSKHDLTLLSKRKPSLIEKRLNSGSANALRMLECATGRSSSCPAGSD